MPHRFRVYHVDEDAADGSDVIVATGYRDRWCDWCGQHQGEAEGWDHCVMCRRPLNQAGWVCGCGHRNPDDAKACESCGADR